MDNFYTYLWLREDGTPYYVGKGCGQRAFVKDKHLVGCPPKGRIILQEWPSEQDAFAAEKFLIAYYGRKDIGTGCLRNRTHGGEGVSGVIVSSETRKRISDAAKNRPCLIAGREKSDEEREKIRIAHLGMRPSETTRAKLVDRAIKRAYRQKQVLAIKLGFTVDELNLCQALSRTVRNREGKIGWRKRAQAKNIKGSVELHTAVDD